MSVDDPRQPRTARVQLTGEPAERDTSIVASTLGA